VSFDSTVGFFGGRGFVSGNPVRPEFFDPAPPRAPGPLRILIVGGSQGAHAINVAMVEAAPGLAAGGLAVTHQTGERDIGLVRDGDRRAGLEARAEPFLFDMADQMKAADLVVCRSGATTIAELTASGRPAIFIPLPTAADDHQRVNAEAVAAAGAAEVIPQAELTGVRLGARIVALAEDEPARQTMSAAARQLARPGAAAAIVDRLIALVEKGA
jgi:UDP-N-acetylglucosamine--N-acetylmuramyl-(pentapeptide) pyrophosphoryl-undecaprenol N-acetylglucosamine transferase